MAGKEEARIRRRRHEEAADWLLRNRDSGQGDAGRAAFRQWLERDPENRAAYEAAQRIMGEARDAIRSEPRLRDFEARRRRDPGRTVIGSLLVLAAAGSAFLFLDGPMRLRADAMSGRGEMPRLTLADGSTMQLNASSAVSYRFDDAGRTVRLLRGQAFFQVADDPRRPFTVEAGEASITTLGTAFDVRLGDGTTDVTVTEHAVLVRFGADDDPALRVDEGQRASRDTATGRTELAPFSGSAALAWQRGQLVVDNAPLSLVVEEIGRHFAGRVIVAGSDLANRRVSGTITVADTDAALAFLELALGVTVTHIGPVIIVSG